MNQIDWLLEAYGLKQGPLFKAMNIQDSFGLKKTVEAGIAMVREMLPEANKCQREPCPVSELTVALQCGDQMRFLALRRILHWGMRVIYWWHRGDRRAS